MKKVKILSQDALRALLGDEELDTGNEGEAADSAGEEAAAHDDGVIDDTESDVDNTEASDSEAGEEAVNFEAKFAELQKEFDEFKATAEDNSTILTERLEFVEKSAKAAEADSALMKQIVCDQIKRMRLALSMADVDMTSMSAEALASEFKSAKAAFIKAMPVGSVTGELKEKSENPVLSRTTVSAYKTALNL
jgi:hypothetical protein